MSQPVHDDTTIESLAELNRQVAAVMAEAADSADEEPDDIPTTVDPFATPVALAVTRGGPADGGIVQAMMAEIRRPLAARLEERKRPQHTPLGDTLCIFNGATGISVNPEDTQLGGAGASTVHLPGAGIVAHWAKEIQLRGHTRLLPNDAHHGLELNFGPLNPALAPPTEAAPDGRHTPPYALMVVRTADAGTSDIPTPAPSPAPVAVSLSDRAYLAEQSAERHGARLGEAVGLSVSAPLAGAASRAKATAAKAASAEADAAQQPAIYVIVEDHIHTDPLSGVTGGVSMWGGPNSTTAAVRGVDLVYLFGYSRLDDILDGVALRKLGV